MVKYFSPGRINIIGEHIDYNGGHVFPAAIDKGTYGDVTTRADQKITLFSKNFPELGIIEIDVKSNYEKTNDWTDYVKGVLQVLAKHGFENKVGFDLVVNGTLPNSSGLSSSASLEVLICKIVSDLNNFNITKPQMAIFSKEAENDFVGVNCGIMDQFIIANAKDKYAMLLNCDTLEFDHVTFDLPDYELLILNSKKKRGLVDSAYNERRTQCEVGKEILKATYDFAEICELTIDQLSAVEDQFDPIVYKRVKHAITEEARVLALVAAAKAKDEQLVGQLINESHQSLKNDYEVSCFELDTFVELSLKNGAIGSRMTGAGFGGCAIALVKSADVESFISTVEAEYLDTTGIKGEIYRVKISEGVDQVV